MNDTRLPPSCMTSVEKLQRFVQAMDKQRAARRHHDSTSTARSIYETNENDLYDSYSADDVRELEDEISESLNMTVIEENMRRLPMLKLSKFLPNSNDKTNGSKLTTQVSTPAPLLTRVPLLTREQQQRHLLEVYHQPISQKDIFYRGNVPIKTSALSRTSCPDLLRAYVYEESAAGISDDESVSTQNHSRRYLFYRRGLSFLHTLRRMLGLQLFRDYRYVIFFVSQFLFYLFYELIYLFPGKSFLRVLCLIGDPSVSICSWLRREGNWLQQNTNDTGGDSARHWTIVRTDSIRCSGELFSDRWIDTVRYWWSPLWYREFSHSVRCPILHSLDYGGSSLWFGHLCELCLDIHYSC